MFPSAFAVSSYLSDLFWCDKKKGGKSVDSKVNLSLRLRLRLEKGKESLGLSPAPTKYLYPYIYLFWASQHDGIIM